MNLDLLDESYPMVKSKLPFEDFDQGGLTGYAIPVRPYYRDIPILGVNRWTNAFNEMCAVLKIENLMSLVKISPSFHSYQC
jgi:hypothetical protein